MIGRRGGGIRPGESPVCGVDPMIGRHCRRRRIHHDRAPNPGAPLTSPRPGIMIHWPGAPTRSRERRSDRLGAKSFMIHHWRPAPRASNEPRRADSEPARVVRLGPAAAAPPPRPRPGRSAPPAVPAQALRVHRIPRAPLAPCGGTSRRRASAQPLFSPAATGRRQRLRGGSRRERRDRRTARGRRAAPPPPIWRDRQTPGPTVQVLVTALVTALVTVLATA